MSVPRIPRSPKQRFAAKVAAGGRNYDHVIDLFAGIYVQDYKAAKQWYERLLGSEPSFVAHETECVWELGEHRFVFINEDAERAGHAAHAR